MDNLMRISFAFALAAMAACASIPPANSPRFGIEVANEASALASAQSPDEKISVLLAVLDHRVEQMEAAAGRRNTTASLVNAYRRIALEAHLKLAPKAGPDAANAIRETLEGHEGRLERIAGGRDALLACRFVLQSIGTR